MRAMAISPRRRKILGVPCWRGVLPRAGTGATAVSPTVVDDEEHVTKLRLPSIVVHARSGQSLAGLMEAGELQAAFDGNAGIGRAGAPEAGWTARIGLREGLEFTVDWYRQHVGALRS